MISAIQAFLASAALSFDFPILDWIQANLQSPLMDKLMPIITMFGDGGVFWIAVAVILLFLPKTRKWGWSMLVALMLGLIVCNITLKPLIARVRPYDLHAELFGDTITLLVKTPHDWSFPSGHTIACFEACTALMIRSRKAGIPAAILAILVSFSRLYLYVHYPTDVIFSVFAGILFGILGCVIVNAVYIKFPEKKGKYEQ